VTPAGLPAEGSILKQVGHRAIDCIQALHIFLVRPDLRSDCSKTWAFQGRWQSRVKAMFLHSMGWRWQQGSSHSCLRQKNAFS